jgi:vacuolar-type H+-ATPase subunit I/STV1
MGVKAQPKSMDELSLTQRHQAGGDNAEGMVQTYEDAFAKIKTATGIEDTAQLVQRFISMEDSNFSLFNYVNELNAEIEQVQEQVASLQTSIEKFQRESEVNDNQRKATLRELEARLANVTEQSKAFEGQHATSAERLNALKQGVSSIFRSPVCDSTVLADMLGNSEITEANVMSFLGAIEQRTNELLQLQALLDQKEKERWEEQEQALRDELEDDTGFDPTSTLGPKPQPGGLLGTGPLPQASVLSIVPPSTTDEDFDLDGDEDRPMSHQELKRKIALGLTSER